MDAQSGINLTFIGGGVLATSIVDGLHGHGKTASAGKPRYNISITAKREEHARTLQERYPDFLVTTNNRDARLWKVPASVDQAVTISNINDGQARSKSIVFICTQPQFTSIVCEDIRHAMKTWPGTPHPIVVTMCPGITIRQLEAWMDGRMPIMRTMPNTPVSEKQGATAMFANSLVSEDDVEQVMNVFRPISPAICLLPREELMDVAASVSGSSPAYFFTLMELLVDAAVRRGMPEEMAAVLVKQSAFGSAMLAQSTEISLHALRKDVCVPGGSTQKAIDCLYQNHLDEIVEAAVESSLLANHAMGAIYS